jgi:hypothetical protein
MSAETDEEHAARMSCRAPFSKELLEVATRGPR